MYVVVFSILVATAFAGISAAPWVPIRSFDIDNLLDDLDLKPGELFVELGCGDGRLLAAASKRGARSVGYEINPALWLIAWVRNAQNPDVSVRLGNLWSYSLHEADAVMVFLVPRTMARLGTKVEAEMRQHTRLASYIFPLPDRKPFRKHKSWFIYTF